MRILKATLIGLACGSAIAGSAQAGGLDRGGYNIDLLFDPGRIVGEAGFVFVAPDRKLKNVTDTNAGNFVGSDGLGGGTTSAKDSEDYYIPRIGVKAGIGDAIDCMFDYSQPWGAHTKPGANWMGANDNIETKVYSDNYAATCSYRFDVGPGQFRVIGGAFYQEVGGFKERLVAPDFAAIGNGVGRLSLKGDGWGWRAGVAYEIPEYAFRTSLVYNSEVDLDKITGTLDLREVFGPTARYDVFGAQKMPDTLELKVQSGIAPDWLAFGSVKWTDWSQLQSIPFCVVGTVSTCTAAGQITSLDLIYRDGWTISGGVGHKFNDQWSGALSLTWDRGTSQGYGTQTDVWTIGAGVSYMPKENIEVRLAGAYSILTSGSSGTITSNGTTYGNEVSYDFGTDHALAVSTSLKVRF